MAAYAEDKELDFLLFKIVADRGVDFRQYSRKYLKRRIAVRMRANQVNTYLEYFQLLMNKPAEYEKLFDALTINVSEFFRNPEAFKAIKIIVLPNLIRSKKEKGSRLIRIWSAGCAGGEEPFSLAILLKEMLREKIDGFHISIYGTEIDKESLNRAEQAEYLPMSLKEVDRHLLTKYFTPVDEKFRVKDELRELVKFQSHNLVSDKPLNKIDIILCRNVVIYFSRKLQERLFMDFHNALNRDGFFIMGKVETLFGQANNLFKRVDLKEKIFQKL